MTGGVSAATIATIATTAVSAAATIFSASQRKSSPTAQQPLVDAARVNDEAAQEAQKKQIAQRRAARANSLLSEAGGVGDVSDPLTVKGGAEALGS